MSYTTSSGYAPAAVTAPTRVATTLRTWSTGIQSPNQSAWGWSAIFWTSAAVDGSVAQSARASRAADDSGSTYKVRPAKGLGAYVVCARAGDGTTAHASAVRSVAAMATRVRRAARTIVPLVESMG